MLDTAESILKKRTISRGALASDHPIFAIDHDKRGGCDPGTHA